MNYTKTGTGPLLIYVCGLDGTGKLFFRQEPELSKRFTVITFPLRKGHSFEYADLVSDVLTILDEEKADKAIFVAESFGGTIALHLALHSPDRIEQLILVNTFPYFRRRALLGLGRLLLPLAFFRVVRWGRDLMTIPIMLSEQVDEESTRIFLGYSWSHDPATYRQRMKLIAEHDVRDQLSQIFVPVTLVAAGKDKIVPSVLEAEFMKERLPNARIHLLPEHGHACMLSRGFSLAGLLSAGDQDRKLE